MEESLFPALKIVYRVANLPDGCFQPRISHAALAGGLTDSIDCGCGEVAEWSKAHAWNACRRETVSRVRIPVSPPLAIARAFARSGSRRIYLCFRELCERSRVEYCPRRLKARKPAMARTCIPDWFGLSGWLGGRSTPFRFNDAGLARECLCRRILDRKTICWDMEAWA